MFDVRIVALLCVLVLTWSVASGEYLIEVALGSLAVMGIAAFCNFGRERKRHLPDEPWYMKG